MQKTISLSVSILRCTSNPVVTENSIIKQVPCGLPKGADVVRYFGFEKRFDHDDVPGLITAAFLVALEAVAVIVFIGIRQKNNISASKRSRL